MFVKKQKLLAKRHLALTDGLGTSIKGSHIAHVSIHQAVSAPPLPHGCRHCHSNVGGLLRSDIPRVLLGEGAWELEAQAC